MFRRSIHLACVALAVLLAGPLFPVSARAHCDGLDGPVVTAARRALARGEVTSVLGWVQQRDEAEIRAAFQHTLAVRRLGPSARELADRYFFETLVRVHRSGEGAPYTGLKPAGRDLGPAIPAADRALETGQLAPVLRVIADATRDRLGKRFEEARARRNYPAGDVAAARRFDAAYVSFIHSVERIYVAATGSAGGHDSAPASPAGHDD